MEGRHISIAGFIGLAATFIVARIYVFLFGGREHQVLASRKAQQAKAMREAYRALEKDAEFGEVKQSAKEDIEISSLTISELWVYPIKSLRGCQVQSALLTAEGFYHDRRFMLMKDLGGSPRKYQNMAISKFPSMCLFHTAIKDNTLTISYREPGTLVPSSHSQDVLKISLDERSEDLSNLEPIDVVMHVSRSTGYLMGFRCSEWFSSRFGFPVILVYWGRNARPVLGNLPGRPATEGPKTPNATTKILRSLPIFGRVVGEDETEGIAFNDCAPYMVISSSSVTDVTSRLPPGTSMDLTKFRSNIVVSTAASTKPYEEDFWAELTFAASGSKLHLTGNCGRCKSLNVDYESGEDGTGKDGKVLQLLQKDRRVDAGWKYSPIFGRYGFVDRKDERRSLRVGEQVVVSKKNTERTKFYWPGLTS